MTIKITVLDVVNNNYMTKEFEKVEKYYFDNGFLNMEFEDKVLMLNKDDIRQITIKKINIDKRI